MVKNDIANQPLDEKTPLKVKISDHFSYIYLCKHTHTDTLNIALCYNNILFINDDCSHSCITMLTGTILAF